MTTISTRKQESFFCAFSGTLRCQRARRALGAATLATAFGASAMFSHMPQARADEVSPTGKGIVGGGLLGAEVVTITEALVGLRNPLFYVVGGAVGAGGGAVAGHFIEQSATDGKVPVYMLAAGLGLIIPAVVLSLNATRYRPSEDATEDHAPTNEPSANPGRVGGSSVLVEPSPAAPAGGGGTPTPGAGTPSTTPPPPQSLLDVQFGSKSETWRMGVPVPQVRPMYTAREQQQLGLPSRTEVRMPVLQVIF